MTLWVFGDSYATNNNYQNQWMNQLSNKINQKLVCLGDDGTSLDYTYKRFNDIRSDINDYDVIVIALTDTNRRWFFRHNPADTIWNIMARNDPASDAIKQYLKYIDNKDPYNSYLFNFLINLHYTTKIKKLHTIILPCFETIRDYLIQCEEYYDFSKIHIAKGCLHTISMNEFMPGFFKTYSMIEYGQKDLRANHLINSNHNILVNMIINNINNNTPMNLNMGFKSNIVDNIALKNKEFSENELFNIHLNEYAWNFHSF